MKLVHVVGARPNFMKIAAVWKAVASMTSFEQVLVHTGQHYDVNMSDVFFTDLGLPVPDHYLGIGSGSHAQQTAAVMVAFEKVVLETQPDMVLVYGDINSTVAAALVCAKIHVKIAHVEAGLRSNDRMMPEELNRIVTDQLADYLFTPSLDGDENLLREGIPNERIHFVGNVMIDSLVHLLPVFSQSTVLSDLGVKPQTYAVMTMHRPSNVDHQDVLSGLLEVIGEIGASVPVVFPIHPRTRKRIAEFGLELPDTIKLVDPLGYVDFMQLVTNSRLVLTDSGGIQEETSYLGIPCLTLRENTERPITIDQGTNVLVGSDPQALRDQFAALMAKEQAEGSERIQPGIKYWDGKAGERIAQVLIDLSNA